MVGIHTILDSDKVINPFSWNAILKRDGKYFSVNHYRSGISQENGAYLGERCEIRYELVSDIHWGLMKMKRPVQ